jgi:hypothetical protein
MSDSHAHILLNSQVAISPAAPQLQVQLRIFVEETLPNRADVKPGPGRDSLQSRRLAAMPPLKWAAIFLQSASAAMPFIIAAIFWGLIVPLLSGGSPDQHPPLSSWPPWLVKQASFVE